MQQDPTAINGIDCTLYLVNDIARAKKFWTETMGLKITHEYPRGSGGEFTLADGTTFGLFKRPDGKWYPGNGVMFAVSDINAAVERYKGLGVEFLNDGKTMESPICFLAFAKDSEGNFFALHQRKV